MVVYADVIFLVNFVSSYIMLFLLGKFIVKAKIKKARLCIASAAGAILAVLIFSAEISLIISYLLRILSVIIMAFISFYEQKRQILSQILWLFAVSGMMIAAMIMITFLMGRTVGVVIKSGVVYFDLPLKIFLPFFTASYIAVILFLRLIQNKRAKRRYIITVTHNGKNITVPALFDSGNLLKEPVTGKCVSILEWSEARRLLDAGYDFSDIADHAEEIKLWAVPFHTVGNKSGIIFAFIADRIDVPEEKQSIEHTFIGIYGGSLSKNNEYRALLNSALL